MELFHDSTLQPVASVSLRVCTKIPNETANKARSAPLRIMDVLGCGVPGAFILIETAKVSVDMAKTIICYLHMLDSFTNQI